MPGGKCRFQDIWLEDKSRNLWLQKGKGKYSAFCGLCKKTIDVTHSGVNALKSHESGKKHKTSEENLKTGKQTTLSSFRLNAPVNQQSVNSTPRPVSYEADSMPSSASSHINSRPCEEVGLASISTFLVSDSVTKAEIVWTCYCMTSQTSKRSGGTAVDLFSIMFPDSHISSKMNLQKDKIAYSATYGLGPYFSKLVCANASKSPFYALSIDESLNEISQKHQMDVVINYWDSVKDCVCTKYLTSAFLERCTANDLLESVTDSIKEANLSLDNLIQLSTDGPNVNLKLLYDINSHMKMILPSEKQILNVGTCSLHIVNGAYKTAHSKVGWKLHEFLRAVHKLFKNFPSRRAIYTQITGSSVFPKKFCSVRWTENSSVIKRCLEILPHLRKYVQDVKCPPDSHNFPKVKEFLCDPTLESKLHFSCLVADELEEFLVIFQKNSPLLPFLFEEVFQLMKSLASRFVKRSVLEQLNSGTKLIKLDLDTENILKHFDQIDVGFGAKSSLKKVKEIDVKLFKKDCRKFLLEMYKKLAEKSPLKRRFVLGASSLNPAIMKNETLRESRAKNGIEELVATNHMTPCEGDKALKEYLRLCENHFVKQKSGDYNWKNDRLDLFFSEIMDNLKEDGGKHVFKFFKIVLVCFHGNAAVERSFSFNKNFLVENLSEKSLIAQRLIHDHINNLPGGIKALDIPKAMILEFRNASARRKEDLKNKKEAEDLALNARKRAFQEIKELTLKKQKVLQEKAQELCEIEGQLSKLKQMF